MREHYVTIKFKDVKLNPELFEVLIEMNLKGILRDKISSCKIVKRDYSKC